MRFPFRARSYAGRLRGAAVALLLAGACSARGAGPARHDVEIRAFRYAPDTITVGVGDTLVWTNHDPVPHTATDSRRRWDTGDIPRNGEGRWVADRAGTEEYVCAYHPGMRATIVVRPER